MVTNNDHWIQRQQKKIKGRRMALKGLGKSESSIFHGEKYHVFESDTQVVIIEKNRMHVPDGIDHATILRDNAQRYLPERCLDVADMMGLSIAKVRLRRMKSCWGTCSKTGSYIKHGVNSSSHMGHDWCDDSMNALIWCILTTLKHFGL